MEAITVAATIGLLIFAVLSRPRTSPSAAEPAPAPDEPYVPYAVLDELLDDFPVDAAEEGTNRYDGEDWVAPVRDWMARYAREYWPDPWRRRHAAEQPSATHLPDGEWIDLAADIRAVDGNHDLGAGALAEALTARGWTRPTSGTPRRHPFRPSAMEALAKDGRDRVARLVASDTAVACYMLGCPNAALPDSLGCAQHPHSEDDPHG